MAYTLGFQGQIAYKVETTYGEGCASDDTVLLLANNVQDVKLTHSRASLGEVHNINSPDINAFVDSTKMYGITTTYLADRVFSSTDCILYHAVTRSNADLSSVAFEVGVGKDQDTSTYFNLKGCKAKSASIEVSEDGPVNVSIDWSVKDVEVSSSITVTAAASAIGTQPWNYVGGSFKRNGAADWGYIVGSASITINNGLQEVRDIGNTTIINAIPGIRSCTGTVNVCLTDGGLGYWSEVVNRSAYDMELYFGSVAASAPKIKITGAILNNIDVPMDSSASVVMTSVPFTGKIPSLAIAD